MPLADLTPREIYEARIAATALAATGNTLVNYTTDQAVDTIANYSYWRPAFASGYPTITYSFPVVDTDPNTPDEPADYIGTGRYGTLRSFSAAQATSARLAVGLWDDLVPLNFVEAGTDANSDMRFFNSTLINTAGGAPAGLGTDGDVWIYNFDLNPPETRDWTVGNFYFAYWMLHEVGHTLGFSHSGSYPGPLYNGLNYLQESNVYTVMSYNSNGDAEVTWTADAGTPMVNDVAAIHYYYGADMTTRTGDTVYGFNSNITDRLSLNFDDMMAQEGKVAPVTIWDAGGSDTLDLSKYIQDAQIDLTEGGYSNAGGQEMSIGIAYGAVVENAIGGYGDDIVFGNTTGNTLRGNDGNDRIYGNTDLAPVVIANPRDFIGVEMNLGTVARNQYLAATGITALSGSQFTFEQMVKLAGAPSSLTAFASYNVSGNDNQFLLEGSGTLKLTIANAAAYDTGVLMASLLDGEPHRLSLTWDKSTGAVGLYIDGAVAHAGIYTAAIGANIKTGGTLVFGQEQDATAGGFDTAQVFQGVLGDLRLFNVSRTEGEISNSAFVALTGAEQGLVHNWQVKTGDTAAVTDVAVVNPAVDLTSLLPANTFTLTQSSSYDQSSGPANVFDNSTATFNHTLNGGNEWLQMNFDQPLAVSFVQIINRPSWGDRLNGATVSLLDSGGNVISTSVAISGAGSGQTINISLAQETTASAVRINQITNFLHIAELNVFGTPPEGVVVDPALINTDLAIVNGATVRSTAPPVLGPDNDTIIGGRGSDQLYGGAGNDILTGDGGLAGDPVIRGLTLNANGATGQSVQQTNLTGLPTTALTLEFEVNFLTAPVGQWFLDFPGVSLLLDPSNTGAPGLWISVGGSWTYSDISVAQLGNGIGHRISFTWDNTTGTFAHYLDGGLVKSGTNLKTGQSLGSGTGAVTLDHVGGAIGDVRIYTRALTSDEVRATATVALRDPANTPDLKLNWQVMADGSVIDAHGGDAPAIAAGAGTPPTVTIVRAATTMEDILDGGAGDDTLSGGFGNDTLKGGDGSDTADWSDATGNVTITLGAGGNGTFSNAKTGTDNYTDIENVTLGNGNDNIAGNNGANQLSGGAGADNLWGGLGADRHIGGDDAAIDYARYDDANYGDLIIRLDNPALNSGAAAAGDTYAGIEGLSGGAGNDVVAGDSLANYLFGQGGSDTIYGGGSGDLLNGGDGADFLYGGPGDDKMVVNTSADKVFEAVGGGTNDFVYTTTNYALAAGQEIEGLSANPQAGTNPVSLTGNAFRQVIRGNNGNNTILAGGGNDSLYGYGGNDTLESQAGNDALFGGAGVDRFQFRQSQLGAASGIDRIYDFAAADYIKIDAISVAAERGLLSTEFALGTTALDASDHVIYDASTGSMWFDADGNGAVAKILFVVLDNKPVVTSADIVLF